MNDEKVADTYWHPAFIQAITLEFKDYLDKIEILPEFPLTAEPLKIDCVIIKKSKRLVIRKNIAAIFKEWNIIEYKNPNSGISVHDFHKVYAYACLYSCVNNAPVTGITVSFILSRHPKNLIRFLTEVKNYTLEKTAPGIYTVKGDVIAMQIINSRLLSDDENLWLKSLRGKLNHQKVAAVVTAIERKGRQVNHDAYLDVIIRENYQSLKEAMKNMVPALKQLIMETEIGASWIAEWQSQATADGLAKGMKKGKAKGMAEGIEKGIALIARNMKAKGLPSEQIAEYTGLNPSDIALL